VLSSPLQRNGAMWCITRHPALEGGRASPRRRTGAGEAEQQPPRQRGGGGWGDSPEHIASAVQHVCSSHPAKPLCSLTTNNSRPGLGATSPAAATPKRTPPRAAADSLHRPATSPPQPCRNSRRDAARQPAASLRNHSVAKAAQSTPTKVTPWWTTCHAEPSECFPSSGCCSYLLRIPSGMTVSCLQLASCH
jgi:hypothetical protein